MNEAVIVAAGRTAIGRRGRGLAGQHPAALLAAVLHDVVGRVDLDPSVVDLVIGGCVTQTGEQTFNIARTAWLSAGLPEAVAATTVDTQCGSSQEAVQLLAGLIRAGDIEVGVACGVESMSRVPLGTSILQGPGHPVPAEYEARHESISQFEAAERIAARWGIDRAAADAFGAESQARAATAWAEGRFDGQVVDVAGITVDEGLRDTTVESIAGLPPIVEGGVHTAGTASQISDGAAVVVLMSDGAARRAGCEPLATVAATALVGVSPSLMLTGPIDATRKLLDRGVMTLEELDVIECNEAFASIVLAFEREVGADPALVNPNGGAIALGHPVGATGAILVTKAVHELRRTGGRTGLVTMCCGGGLGTATLLRR